MIKVLSQTILGFFLSLSGFYTAYISLKGVEERAWTWLLFLPALPVIALGGFLLFRAGKSEASIFTKKVVVQLTPEKKPEDKEDLARRIQKNNAMDADWKKTNDARNRLQMLQLSADAQEKA